MPNRAERKLMDAVETQSHNYADRVVGKQKEMPKKLQEKMKKDPDNGIRWIKGQMN